MEFPKQESLKGAYCYVNEVTFRTRLCNLRMGLVARETNHRIRVLKL